MLFPNSPYRVLFLGTHPVQYAAPLYRRMTQDERLSIHVAYLTLAGASPFDDEEFGRRIQWDVPLLDGYSWSTVPSLRALLELVRGDGWDAVISYLGYRRIAFWVALAAAKQRRTPYMFSLDAHSFESRSQSGLRALAKTVLLPRIYHLADVAIAASTASRAFLLDMGVESERVVVVPSVVHNEWWTAQAAIADRATVRAQWGIPPNSTVVLFAAKLQPWKRPLELLRAFSRVERRADVYLVFAGEGPLREEIEREARAAKLAERVRLLGFTNQSALPGVYNAADVFVLPSAYEPFGVVVNEAMLCGCCVVVSDKVGAARDLVLDGLTGLVYPSGDETRLGDVLARLVFNEVERAALAAAGRARISSWSPQAHIDALVRAVSLARASRR